MSPISSSAYLPEDDVDPASLQHPSIAEAIARAGEFAAENATRFEDIHADGYSNKQLIRGGMGAEFQRAAQLLEDSPDNVYRLSSQKLVRYRRGIERRSMKDQLSDRRSKLRFDSNGEIQKDRRAANRLANLDSIRALIKH